MQVRMRTHTHTHTHTNTPVSGTNTYSQIQSNPMEERFIRASYLARPPLSVVGLDLYVMEPLLLLCRWR